MPKPKARTSVQRVNSWWPRFWAWLIDAIILGIVTAILLPTSWPINSDPFRMGATGVISLIYWTILESNGRQSIGKKALNLRVVTITGKNIDGTKAFVSAFGKAFLLPIDFIIGVLARPGKKQRLFNIASDTIVVRK
jgi:uncharacterized RDD family membrane protein YckC